MTARLFAWRVTLPALTRVVPITTLTRLMWATPAAMYDERQRRARIAIITYILDCGGVVLVSANCLERSLVLYRMLSEAAANPTLVIGTRTEGSSLAAHAWIELNGQTPWESTVAQYSRIVAFGPRGQPTDAFVARE